MDKAYDLKGLVAELKGSGLEIAEEGGKVLVDAVFKWLEDSATLSATPYDDLLKVLYPQAKVYVLEQVEKINKADNA